MIIKLFSQKRKEKTKSSRNSMTTLLEYKWDSGFVCLFSCCFQFLGDWTFILFSYKYACVKKYSNSTKEHAMKSKSSFSPWFPFKRQPLLLVFYVSFQRHTIQIQAYLYVLISMAPFLFLQMVFLPLVFSPLNMSQREFHIRTDMSTLFF